MLFTAKADVGRPVLRNGKMGYLLAILVEYGNTIASQIDVPPVVYRHPVRSHVGKHLAVRQGAIRQDVISQNSVFLCLCDIQMFAVGRSDNPIRLVKR